MSNFAAKKGSQDTFFITIKIMTSDEYTQFKAFIRQDGIFIAALWTLSFACVIGEFKFQPLATVGAIVALLSPIFAIKRLRRYRDWGLNGKISFSRALGYGITLFIAASLLFCLVQYIYFKFIDNGYLMQQYETILASKQMQEALATYQLEQQMEQSMQLMSQMTALEKAANFLPVNIFIGVALSILMALIIRKDNTAAVKAMQNENNK